MANDLSKRKRCGSPLRGKPGEFCQSPVIFKNGRCELHGGKSKKGMEHPRYIDGRSLRYEKSLPLQIFNRMREHLDDATLLELNAEIALVTTMIEEAQRKLFVEAEGENLQTWRRVLSYKERILQSRTDAERGENMRKLLSEIEKAEKLIGAQDELLRLLDMRRKLVESETSRQLKLSQNITLENVNALFLALANAVREEVDRGTLARIFNRFDQISHRANVQLLEQNPG